MRDVSQQTYPKEGNHHHTQKVPVGHKDDTVNKNAKADTIDKARENGKSCFWYKRVKSSMNKTNSQHSYSPTYRNAEGLPIDIR